MSSECGSSEIMQNIKECMYGELCYRRNAQHFQEYRHSHLEDLLAQQRGDEITLPRGFSSTMESHVLIEQLRVLSSIKRSTERSHVKQPGNNSGNSKEHVANIVKKPLKQVVSEIECNAGTSTEKRKMDPDTVVWEKMKKKCNGPGEEESVSKHELPLKTLEKCRASKSSIDAEGGTSGVKTYTNSKGNFIEKWECSQPYNLFLTAVTDSPRTQAEGLSVKFKDLIDPSMGAIESSMQINFMVELEWLLNYYERAGIRKQPLLILYGVEDSALKDKRILGENIKAFHVKPSHPFGHHHTKMSIFKYTDGSVRVIVSTANLIESDWENRTQGVWISPRCMPLPVGANTSDGESPTNFRADLVRYLSYYKLSAVREWVVLLQKIDFSPVRVCLVASVPGSHQGPDFRHWGHLKARHLLHRHCSRACRNEGGGGDPWPLVIQCSSIGSLGPSPSAWLCGEFRSSLSETIASSVGTMPNLKQPTVKVVYPSLKNVSQSYDGLLGGACLPYSIKTHVKQQWLSDYLHD
ncbi:probable tyrosyl-DNA phosphodiesterase isoform X2 [Ischnura elegans]|uniref:probable tyrosyl-DNA phosphodiesterase isoform X2 n=1 Tax=Ischnura elegans TaxID=197161 RepID=UPI001ED8A2EE|nr:probable tyrosyl-DNA phosphodiesterase isoform X2 [Ischnura elegans]